MTSMEKSIEENESFFNEYELMELHLNKKNRSMTKVRSGLK